MLTTVGRAGEIWGEFVLILRYIYMYMYKFRSYSNRQEDSIA